MTDTPMPDDEVEKILKKHLPGMSLNVNKSLSQAINRLLLEARIDELEKWAGDAIDSKPTTYDFQDRIAELKKLGGEG